MRISKALLMACRLSVIGILGVLLVGCGRKTYEVKTKLEVVVETPNGILTGQTIYQAWLMLGRGVLVSGGAYSTEAFRGEAVALKMPNGQFLFVPLRDDMVRVNMIAYSEDIDRLKIPPMEDVYEAFDTYSRSLASMRGRRPIPPDEYPPMVMFRDLNNPRSAVQVWSGNFSQIFGPGTSFKGMYLSQIDPDAPVSKGRMKELLPWLGTFGRKAGEYLSFRKQPDNPSDEIQIKPQHSIRNVINMSSSNFDTEIFR